MEETNGVILAKSEMKPQKKKIMLAWIIVALFFAAKVVAFFICYNNYKEGQHLALATLIIANGVDAEDSLEDQCYAAHRLVSYDYGYGSYDEELNDLRSDLRSSLEKILKSGGYYRYGSNCSDVDYWFEYASAGEYFFEYFIFNYFLCFILYLFIVLAVIYSRLTTIKARKELVVYEDSVLCKMNSKKSKQLIFEDINKVVTLEKDILLIIGSGIKFKISYLTNAESLKTIILEKKEASKKFSTASADIPLSGADELKKYKELLDAGVISQDEFDAKKKQLLGL